MNNVNHLPGFLRKRKMMLVFPLLIFPFLTMAFWALGGGKASRIDKRQTEQGLNLQLPKADLKDEKGTDKMSFYDQADKDSIKLAEMIRNDPYYHNQDSMKKEYSNQLEKITENSAAKFNQSYLNSGLKTSHYNNDKEPAEQKVMAKIAELNKVINEPKKDLQEKAFHSSYDQNSETNRFGRNIDHLANMMQVMNNDKGENTEMKELNGTLEKILDIQHPERVKDKLREASLKNKTEVFPVRSSTEIMDDSYMQNDRSDTLIQRNCEHNRFYDLNTNESHKDENNSVAAAIQETQTLVSAATVKLRLLNDIYVGGILVPKNSFVFGTATLEDERLLIKISTIRYRNNIFPVKLSVYDMDGLAGVYIPGSISRDVAKQSADQTMQGIEMMSLDPSLKVQAANAGIQAAKSLLSKKIKLVKVTVKAGYQVLLRDDSKQEN